MNRKLFLALFLVGIAFRIFMLTSYELVNGGEVDVYLADEGIVGLMGKHILEGNALPVFFYGQHYLGALEAYLAALSFAVFGVSMFALRMVTFTSSLALLWGVYTFTKRAYSQTAARWATVLVAIGPMYFLQWNLKARGGFIEHVFLLFVVMILFWRYAFGGDRRPSLAFLLGFVAGVAFWVNQLVMAYFFIMVPVLLLDREHPHRWRPLVAGFLLGACLLIGYNVVHPLATFRTLARKSVTLNRVPVTERDEHWLIRGIGKRVEALTQGADKLGMVFGVPPRAKVAHLGLSKDVREGNRLTGARQLLAVVPLLVFGVGLIASCSRRKGGDWSWRSPDQILFLFFLVTFLVGYVSPRYMLPAYPLAAVAVGATAARLSGNSRAWLLAGIAAVLCYNLLSWADVSAATGRGSNDRISTLVDSLESNGLTRCYSAGPMYHAVFASGERTIMSPLQKDRYPPYRRLVNEADRICYIFRNDQKNKRQHLAFMRLLSDKGVSFEQAEAGPYTILYDFTPRSAITEAGMEAVRHQEKVRFDLDRLLKPTNK